MSELLLRERERVKIESDTLMLLKWYDICQVYAYFKKMYKKFTLILLNDPKNYDKYNKKKFDSKFLKGRLNSAYHVMYIMYGDTVMWDEYSRLKIHFMNTDPYNIHLSIKELLQSWYEQLDQKEFLPLIDMYSLLVAWVYYSRHKMHYYIANWKLVPFEKFEQGKYDWLPLS